MLFAACKMDADNQFQNPPENQAPKLPAPNAPVVTAQNGSLTLQWNAVSGAQTYEVFLSTSQNPPSSPTKKDIPGTSTIMSGLENKIVYYIWVRAVGSEGAGAFSPRVRGIPWPGSTAPATPEQPVIKEGINQLTAEWTITGGATSYKVYISTSLDSEPSTPIITTYTTSAVIGGLDNGFPHYIWIQAVNPYGSSGLSFPEVGTPKDPTVVPAAPGAPLLVPGNKELTVSWDTVEMAQKYEVWLGKQDNSAFAEQKITGISGSDTEITVGSLTNETIYYVWVRAGNILGFSGMSPSASAKPSAFTVAPAAPGTPAVAAGSKTLTVSWQTVEGALSYELWTGTESNALSAAKYGGDITGTSATIPGLTNGITYYFWLKAKNLNGSSGLSPMASGTPTALAVTPLAPAAAPQVTAGDRQLSLSWQAVDGATHYELWAGTSADSSQATKRGGDVTGLSGVISQLTNGTPYYVWIKAKNSVGTSGFSPGASGMPSMFTAVPQPPKAPTVSLGSEEVTLSWVAAGDASSYEIYMAPSNNSAAATQYGEAIYDSLSAVVSGLTNGNTYYIWLKGINDIGPGGFSSPSVAVKPIADAAPPVLVPGNNQISVSWTAMTGVEQYEVFYGTGTTPPQTASQTINAPATSTTITSGITNGTTYNVWLRGKNTTGQGMMSSYACVKPIGNMGTVTVSAKDGQLSLSWLEVAGADHYEVYCEGGFPIRNVLVFNFSTTTATINELDNGIKYIVWVKPVNAYGSGGVSVDVDGMPLAVPGSISVSASNQKITLNWDAVSGATSYDVYYNNVSSIPSNPDQNVTVRTAEISGLVNGTTYYFWVKAKNANGTSEASPRASAKPIGNIGTVTLTPGNGFLTANWASVAGADQYEVYYSGSITMPGTPGQTVSTATATINDLTNGTACYVWVRPTNTNGSGSVSAMASGTPMAAPGAISLIAGNEQVALSWESVPGASGYEVYYSTSSSIPLVAFDTITGTVTTITNLVNGTPYYFWVKAKNANGLSAASPVATGKPIGNMGTVTLTAGNGQLTASWTSVPGADQYDVYYDTGTEMPGSPKQTVSAASYILTGLSNGIPYNVWVKPKNSHGAGAVSAVVNATPVGAQGSIAVSAANTQVTLSWGAVPGATGYEVYYSTSPAIPGTAFDTVIEPGKTISGLTNGTTYYFWVKTINPSGTGTTSPMANAKPIGNMGNLTLVSGTGQITVSWSSVAGADQYEIYCSTGTTIPGTPEKTVSAISTIMNNLDNGTPYYFWVKPVNAYGAGAVNGVTASGTPMAAPGALTLSSANQQIIVSWAAVSGATSYEVYYSTGTSIPASPTDTVTVLTKTISGLTNGATYNFWVKAKNANGTSAAGAMAGAKPIGNMGTVTVNSGGSGQLTLNWAAVGGADQCDIFQNTTNSMPASSTRTVTTTNTTFTGLSNGTTYYFWIMAKNPNGSSTSAAAIGKPLAAPGAPVLSAAPNKLMVNWAAVAGADQYEVYYGTGTPATLAATTSNTNAVIAGLKNGTTYNVLLRAKNSTSTLDAPVVSETVGGTHGLYRESVKIGSLNLADSLIYISSNAVSGDNYFIVLGANENSAPVVLGYSDKTVGITLLGDGAERIITLTSNGSLFTINNGVTLTLDNNITLHRNNINTYLVAIDGLNSALIMNEGARIIGNNTTVGAGVSIRLGNFTMNGGKISGHNGTYGGGVSIGSGGSFIMNGGEISGNNTIVISSYGVSYGSGVYNNGIFNMNGGEISNNGYAGFGGGVYNKGTFNMNAGEISNNNSTHGGGVYNEGIFNMNAGEISNNEAVHGGGVNNYGTFNMNAGEISNNNATTLGGGVCDYNTFYMKGGEISGNRSGWVGGGVHVSWRAFLKTGGTIYGYSVGNSKSNIAGANGYGHAVLNEYIGGYRDTTAGTNVNMDSSIAGAAGGWEN